jgi:NAD(P)H-dependent FMN reductase
MGRKVVAIVGSYRRGGTVDTAVQAVLEGARENGAETQTIYLTDAHIEFCTNCRRCTQAPGVQRGQCVQQDDLQEILEQIDAADAVVLGSPVNCYNLTAIFRRFMERLVGSAYWPWGQAAPKFRDPRTARKAVLVASSAAPGFCIPLFTGAARALRVTARMLGARTVGKLWIGLSAQQPQPVLPARTLERARRLGRRLVYRDPELAI